MNEEYLCCMSEDLNIITGTKAEQYESLIPQIKGLLEGEPDIIANLANIVAALKEQFDWLWIGFYLVKSASAKASADKPTFSGISMDKPTFPGTSADRPTPTETSYSAKASSDNSADKSALVENSELVLGPFQGPIACTRIRKGKGVCGTSWEKAQTIIVPHVEKFPGHIACSSLSRSEIVVPVIRDNEVIAVLDVDSDELNHFDEVDRIYLEKIIEFIEF
jgi:L-methionine (R)-S-oxide reductase